MEEGKKCERRPATRTPLLQYNSCARTVVGRVGEKSVQDRRADRTSLCRVSPTFICYANNINICVRAEKIRYGPSRVADDVLSGQYDLRVCVH